MIFFWKYRYVTHLTGSESLLWFVEPLESAYSTTEKNKDNFGSQTGKAGYLDNTIAAQQQQIDIFTKILVGGELDSGVSLIFRCANFYYITRFRNRITITVLRKRRKNCLFQNNLLQGSFLTIIEANMRKSQLLTDLKLPYILTTW